MPNLGWTHGRSSTAIPKIRTTLSWARLGWILASRSTAAARSGERPPLPNCFTANVLERVSCSIDGAERAPAELNPLPIGLSLKWQLLPWNL